MHRADAPSTGTFRKTTPVNLLRCALTVLTAAVAAPSMLSACATEPPATGEVVQEAIICPSWMCGTNSPVIATYAFHELNVRGLANAEGFAITKFRKGATPYQVAVVGGQLVGTSPGGATISGQQLIGAQLVVSRGLTNYVIKVEALAAVPYYAKRPGSPVPSLEAYRLLVSSTSPGTDTPYGDWRNLCARPLVRADLNLPGDMAVVFEGDRIDPDRKRVYGYDTSWFNIGCAGHTLAKMYLTGHVAAAANDGYVTTRDERQTILKMFSADYCGTGKPFTVAGVKLSWADDHQWMSHALGAIDLEARWTPYGAQCLNVPRLVANPTVAGDAAFPGGVGAAIAAECGLPACPNPDPYQITTHLVSANPQ